jgi:ABC-2 type transport system permease protein
MIDAIRSEWIKLRTARSNVVLICLAVAAPLALSILISIFTDFEFSDGNDTFSATVLGPCYLCVFLAGVVGVLGIGQEYRHNTIRVTFTGEPRRSRVLSAKIVVTTLFGLAIGLGTQLLCFGSARIILGVRDVAIGFNNPGENLTAFVGLTLLCGLFTLLGFGLGAIMRQPAGAIPVLLLWPLIGEGILRGVLFAISESLVKWLPVQAGLRLATTGETDDLVLSRLASGAYFTAWVVVVVAIGWLLVERRDA